MIDRRQPAARAAGFTLLEMLVVVTIVALVAIVAMPLLTRPSDSLQVQAVARELIGALRLTRAAAIVRNGEIALAIDVDRRTFQSPVVPVRSFADDFVVQLKVAEPERAMRSLGGFRFFPDGSSTGGDVFLGLRGKEARICVDWLTGAARLAGAC